MQHYTDTLFDTLGNAIAGATVTVYQAGTLTPATLYSTNTGTALSNPLTTGLDGSFDFYAINGRYDLVMAKTGYTFVAADTAGIVLFDPLYGQVAFPSTQNPSSDPNTLDDYEEGTWTPDLGGNATYTARSGTYVKIGKMVFFQGSLTVNVLGTGTTNVIAGLPFIANEEWPVSIGETASLAVSPVSFNAQVGTSTQTIYLYGRTAGATGTSLLAALGNGAAIKFAGCYRAQA